MSLEINRIDARFAFPLARERQSRFDVPRPKANAKHLEAAMGNRFHGVGNLGAKPELKHVDQNGESMAILDLRIYFDRRVSRDGGDTFEDRGGFWITASLWGQRAERAAEVLDKGMRVYASGTLMTDTWLDPSSTEARTEMKLHLDYLALDLSRVKSVQMESKKTRAEGA